jgi:hypothetical protein
MPPRKLILLEFLLLTVISLDFMAYSTLIKYSSEISKHSFQLRMKGDYDDTLLRLERIVSNRGGISRTESSKLIQQGKIWVDNKVIKSGSKRFPMNSNISVNGKVLPLLPLIAAFHKPVGMLSTIGDPW